MPPASSCAGKLSVARYEEEILFAETLTRVVSREVPLRWSGLSIEGLVAKGLSRRFAVQAGLIVDFALDLWYYQPVAQLSYGFN